MLDLAGRPAGRRGHRAGRRGQRLPVRTAVADQQRHRVRSPTSSPTPTRSPRNRHCSPHWARPSAGILGSSVSTCPTRSTGSPSPSVSTSRLPSATVGCARCSTRRTRRRRAGCTSPGIDHYPWLNDDYFSRDGIGTTGTLLANHTWAGWADVFSTYGPLSTPSLHYSEYFIELIKAFHTDLDRRCGSRRPACPRCGWTRIIPTWTERRSATWPVARICGASPGGARTRSTARSPASTSSSTTSACTPTTAGSSRSAPPSPT